VADIDAFVRTEAAYAEWLGAANERLPLANYYRGVRAAAYTFEELARPEVVAALRAWRG
jgi:hypothetical protein